MIQEEKAAQETGTVPGSDMQSDLCGGDYMKEIAMLNLFVTLCVITNQCCRDCDSELKTLFW